MWYTFGMKIGYARVSSAGQNLDRQVDALHGAGCKKIYVEKQSGASTHNRPELEKAIKSLKPKDVLVLAEWDRATRSMMDGIKILERVQGQHALIKVLDRQWLDLTTPIGKGILAFLSALAEDERHRINRRAGEGRSIAKTKGVQFGRKPKLTPHQQTEAIRMIGDGQSIREVARTLGVGKSSISRVLDKARI